MNIYLSKPVYDVLLFSLIVLNLFIRLASLIGACYLIWFCSYFLWEDNKNISNYFIQLPHKFLMVTGYCLLSLILVSGVILKKHDIISLGFIYFLDSVVYLVGFVLFYLQKRFYEEENKVINEAPKSFSSMASLYNVPIQKRILGKKRKTDFKCIHCTKPLTVYGRYQCRAGHVPPLNRYIFENCHQCDDIHEFIKCESCGKEIDLYNDQYNQEEIDNRGKDFISRENPYKGLLLKYIVWSLIFYLTSVFYLTFSMGQIDLWNGFLLYLTMFGLLISSIINFSFIPQKEKVMENPYSH